MLCLLLLVFGEFYLELLVLLLEAGGYLLHGAVEGLQLGGQGGVRGGQLRQFH